MAETKVTKVTSMRTRWMARFLNSYLVLRTWSALTFFIIAYGFFNFVLRIGGDLGRTVTIFYGAILLIICFALIGEYVLKTLRLQRDNAFKTYSTIVSVNTVFGLIFSLIYINIILAVVIRAMAQMTYLGTFWCNIRMSIVGFYYNTQIYSQLNTLIFWAAILTLILFLFGGLLERLFRRN